jgi:hypothetical protein
MLFSIETKSISLILLMSLLSCTNQRKMNTGDSGAVTPYPHIINMAEGLKNNTQLKLSDIADSVKYIVLSKDKEVVIGSFRRLQMTDNDIYINSDGLVLRFDLSGKFLNSIGRNGRGPEEYLQGNPYSTTPNNDKIIISKGVTPEYLIFKPNGEYLGKKGLSSSSRNLYDFAYISDSTLLITYYFVGSFMPREFLDEMSCTAGLFESDGHPIKLILNPLRKADISKTDLKRIIIPFPTYTFFDNRAVLTQNCDTIYEISDNSIFPGFIVDWGKLPHKRSIDELYFRNVESSVKFGSYGTVPEISKKVYFGASNKGISYMFEYDKTNGTSRSMELDSDNTGFINDLDGGSNYYPYWTSRAGDIWIATEDAISFKEKHSDELLSISTAVRPELKKKLIDFTKKLKQDDNPVLKILYLKK